MVRILSFKLNCVDKLLIDDKLVSTYGIPTTLFKLFGTRDMETFATTLLITAQRGPLYSTQRALNPTASHQFFFKVDRSIIFKINIRGPTTELIAMFYQPKY